MHSFRVSRLAKPSWLLGLAIIFAVGPKASVASEPQTVAISTAVSPSILADNRGAISEVLFHFPASDNFGIRDVIADLLLKLSPQVKVVVACPNRSTVEIFERELGRKARLGGRSVRVFDVGMDISMWARDRCIARQHPDGSHASLLVPRPFPTFDVWRLNEVYTPFALEAVGAFPDARATSLILEGGNIVSNARYAFVGANVIDENRDGQENPENSKRLMRGLRQLAGKEVILVGDENFEVPWDHLDMYLTPVGDNTLLLADPELASLILGVDSIDLSLTDDQDQESVSSIDTAFILDQIAERLRRSGFVVLRLPTIVNYPEQWMVTYNNVLMDERENGRTAFMPIYGIDALDAYAKRVYEQIGFRVETVDVMGIYESGGALRCVTNVTRRGANKPAKAS